VTLAVGFAVANDLLAGRLVHVKGSSLRLSGEWCASIHAAARPTPARGYRAGQVQHVGALHTGDDPRHWRRRHPVPAESSRHAVELGRGQNGFAVNPQRNNAASRRA
jgi:hypothetical protein